MIYKLDELIDVTQLQELFDSLDEIYNIPSAIIDSDGKILTATAWQEICTKFHRVNPETEKHCIESDTSIASQLSGGKEQVIYKCPRGLVDTATPIVIEGVHLGDAFTGQLFLEPPDEDFFRDQAREFGFNEKEYIEALKKVPVITEDKLKKNLSTIHRLAIMLAEQGLKQKRLIEAEEIAREREIRYRTLFQQSPHAVVLFEPDTMLPIEFNDKYPLLLGYTRDEVKTLRIPDYEAQDDLDAIRKRIQFFMNNSGLEESFETRFRCKDNTVKDVHVNVKAMELPDKTYLHTILQDITKSKIAEKKIVESLKEKEVLLKEIHHRVKNNMAVISSMLDLQANQVDDNRYRSLIQESQGRIKSMALVHEKLYQTDDFININLEDYVKTLVKYIELSYGADKNYAIDFSIEAIKLDIDLLIPTGLIINELITNIFKHAFKSNVLEKIQIKISKIGNSGISLIISDMGEGLPDDFSIKNSAGLGLKLVDTLVQQIKGDLTVSSEKGTVFEIEFPGSLEYSRQPAK